MERLIQELNLKFTNNVKEMKSVFETYDLKYLKNTIFEQDDTKCYQRKILYQNDKYEIILIKWNKNSECEIHDHSKNGCLLKVLDGNIKEFLFDHKLNLLNENIYKTNEINYIDNKIGYHKIKNLQEGESYSLHLYSPPNHKTNYFKNNIL